MADETDRTRPQNQGAAKHDLVTALGKVATALQSQQEHAAVSRWPIWSAILAALNLVVVVGALGYGYFQFRPTPDTKTGAKDQDPTPQSNDPPPQAVAQQPSAADKREDCKSNCSKIECQLQFAPFSIEHCSKPDPEQCKQLCPPAAPPNTPLSAQACRPFCKCQEPSDANATTALPAHVTLQSCKRDRFDGIAVPSGMKDFGYLLGCLADVETNPSGKASDCNPATMCGQLAKGEPATPSDDNKRNLCMAFLACRKWPAGMPEGPCAETVNSFAVRRAIDQACAKGQ